MYNQNLRLKFGSAPAQLITKGFMAEKSLEMRTNNIRKEIEDSNNVSVKSQLSQNANIKAAARQNGGSVYSERDIKSKSADFASNNANRGSKSQKSITDNNQHSLKNSLDARKRENKLPDSPDSSDNEDKQDDQLTESARSKRSSNLSIPNSPYPYEEQNNKKISLPLLNIRSPQSNNNVTNNDELGKKKSNVVLPSIA